MNAITQRWMAVVIGVALVAAAGGHYLARYGARPGALAVAGPRQRAASGACCTGTTRCIRAAFRPAGQVAAMDMPLQPRYADAARPLPAVISRSAAHRSGVMQNAVRYTTVERGPWSQSLDALAASSSISAASPSSRRARAAS
jgi:hypothetical protein